MSMEQKNSSLSARCNMVPALFVLLPISKTYTLKFYRSIEKLLTAFYNNKYRH